MFFRIEKEQTLACPNAMIFFSRNGERLFEEEAARRKTNKFKYCCTRIFHALFFRSTDDT